MLMLVSMLLLLGNMVSNVVWLVREAVRSKLMFGDLLRFVDNLWERFWSKLVVWKRFWSKQELREIAGQRLDVDMLGRFG